MSVGSITSRGRRITVEFDPTLADRIADAAAARSTVFNKVTVSDIVREAVASFLLPGDGRISSQHGRKDTGRNGKAGSLS